MYNVIIYVLQTVINTKELKQDQAYQRLCSEGCIFSQFGRNYPIFTELH